MPPRPTGAGSATPSGLAVLGGFVRLLRPGNAAMAALGAATGAVLVVLTGTPTNMTWLAILAPPLLIAAFGNVLNDITDLEIDRVAHPQRPLPSGTVTRPAAILLAAALLALGFFLAVPAGWKAVAFAAVNAALLGLYEWRLKSSGLPGNLLVGALVGSTFLYGGVAVLGAVPLDGMLWLLAGMAATSNAARELLKDSQDRDADQGHRRTFALRHGAGKTALLALALVNLAVLASTIAFVWQPAQWWPWWLAGLALADVLFLLGACLAWLDVGTAQRTLKVAMLVALLAFLLGASIGPGPSW